MLKGGRDPAFLLYHTLKTGSVVFSNGTGPVARAECAHMKRGGCQRKKKNEPQLRNIKYKRDK